MKIILKYVTEFFSCLAYHGNIETSLVNAESCNARIAKHKKSTISHLKNTQAD